MNEIQVELHVPNLDQARDFYATLGFCEVWRDRRIGSQYLVMALGNSPVSFRLTERPHGSFGSNDEPRGRGVELVLSVENVDSTYKTATALGGLIEELQTRPWGLRDFRIVDPFGYYLRFTEPSDVLSPHYGGRPPS